MRQTRPVSTRSRRLVLSALMVLAPLVATAAAAWACTPQARLSLDKTEYEPGSTITAIGGGFSPHAVVSVTVGDSAWTSTTTTANASESGAFSATLKAPMNPGPYTVTATSSAGQAPATFSVVAPPAPPPPPSAPPPPPPPAVDPVPVAPAPVSVSVTPEPAPALPSPVLAPDLTGPTLLRQARANETVRVSRTGVLEIFCGRADAGQVRGSCGAASTRKQAGGTAPLIELRPKAFRVDAGSRVQIRFHLKPRALRALREARRLRMRGTSVVVGANGIATTTSFAFTLKAPRRMRR